MDPQLRAVIFRSGGLLGPSQAPAPLVAAGPMTQAPLPNDEESDELPSFADYQSEEDVFDWGGSI